jgi:hypothetical protein
MWRVAMKLGYEDRRWLCVPIAVPLLHRYRPGEDGVQRAYRQAAASDQVLYVDACTGHGHGMGFYSRELDGTPLASRRYAPIVVTQANHWTWTSM